MARIQFSNPNPIKIGCPEHSLHPPPRNRRPATSVNISFLPYKHPPLKVDVICVSPLSNSIKNYKRSLENVQKPKRKSEVLLLCLC